MSSLKDLSGLSVDPPNDWSLTSIRGITLKKKELNHPDEELLSVYRDYGVIIKSSRDDNHNQASSDLSNYQLVKPGELVINKMKTWQGSLGVSQYRGIISPAYIVCKITDPRIHGPFLNYFLRSKHNLATYNALSYGVRIGQWDMHYEDFKNISVMLPPASEQIKIANFIDKKLKKITFFIQNKEAYIEKLIERRQSVVSKHISNGGDNNSPMQDEVNQWQGPTPDSWSVRTLKSMILKSTNGAWGKEEGEETIDLPCVRVADFRYSRLDTITKIPTRRSYKETEVENKKLNSPCILMEKSGGGEKTLVGRVVVWDKGYDALCSNFITQIILDEEIITYNYFALLMSCLYSGRINYKYIKATTGIQNIDEIQYFKEYVALPEVSEQQKIVSKIEQETRLINQAIRKAERQIDLINEYRDSLITNVVTGKVRIGN